MNGSKEDWILYFRAEREVKAISEDCPPGKEEGKKALSSISTSFPRRWKSRPAQRITGDFTRPIPQSPALLKAFFKRFIVQSLPFPSIDSASPNSSIVRAPFPPNAPPTQAYHAWRLRRFLQTVFATGVILPAGCMGGLPLAAAFC
ncbi:hypothetical protein LXL04_035406 [Taraxacum kok-saghyz]